MHPTESFLFATLGVWLVCKCCQSYCACIVMGRSVRCLLLWAISENDVGVSLLAGISIKVRAKFWALARVSPLLQAFWYSELQIIQRKKNWQFQPVLATTCIERSPAYGDTFLSLQETSRLPIKITFNVFLERSLHTGSVYMYKAVVV